MKLKLPKLSRTKSIILLFILITASYLLLIDISTKTSKETTQIPNDNTTQKTSLSSELSADKINMAKMEFDQNTGQLDTPYLPNKKGENKLKLTLNIPSSWKISRMDINNSDYTIEIINSNYTLTISGPTYESGECIYKNADKKEGGYEIFDNYEEFSLELGILRFGHIDTSTNQHSTNSRFQVCQKLNGKWEVSTSVGYIFITGPLNFSQSVINEAVSIIKSIKILQV